MKFARRVLAGVALFCVPAFVVQAAAPYSVLHAFQGAESSPQAALISDGRGNLYGTTARGGPSDGGTVFTLRSDGTLFQRLHVFAGGASDGFQPAAALALDGSGFLYGTTPSGGAANGGTVFRLRTDGTEFELLHSFAGDSGDGWNPRAALTLDGNGNLYGTTSAGGATFGGTIFRLRTDGSGFALLHAFAGGTADGRDPRAALLLDSGVLYGTTIFGGGATVLGTGGDGLGTVFRIRTDGTAFQVLRAFSDDAREGANPAGPLIADASGNLYGLTTFGGASSGGTLFRVGKNGAGFLILHAFAGGSADGKGPVGGLVPDTSGNIYGLTTGLGSFGGGLSTIFKVRADGSGYRLLHTFVDARDGSLPAGSLILDGTDLLGATADAGDASAGTVFSIDTGGSVFRVLHAFAGFTGDGGGPSAALVADGSGSFYGTTSGGGSARSGTIYRISSDGSGFQVLHAFRGGPDDGSAPWAALLLDRAGNLYGTTTAGGPSNGGTVFRLRTDGSGFQILHAFAGGSADGFAPQYAGLTFDAAGTTLYGTTFRGGPADTGTVFRMKTDGSLFQLVHTFAGIPGDGPEAGLVLDAADTLYGTTHGASDAGSVFRVKTDGSGYQVLHTFRIESSSDFAYPRAPLVLDGSGTLYGTTFLGGSARFGTVFKVRTDGSLFEVLHSFADDASDGGLPYAPVVLDAAGNLYGATSSGGQSNGGTVFTMRTDGSAYRTLHAFGSDAADGRTPVGSLTLDTTGRLVGTAFGGGTANVGVVFALVVARHGAVASPGPFSPVHRH